MGNGSSMPGVVGSSLGPCTAVHFSMENDSSMPGVVGSGLVHAENFLMHQLL